MSGVCTFFKYVKDALLDGDPFGEKLPCIPRVLGGFYVQAGIGTNSPQALGSEEILVPRHIQPLPRGPRTLHAKGRVVWCFHHQNTARGKQGTRVPDRLPWINAVLQRMKHEHHVEPLA